MSPTRPHVSPPPVEPPTAPAPAPSPASGPGRREPLAVNMPAAKVATPTLPDPDEPDLRLPHERDQSGVDVTAAAPDPMAVQAAKDIAAAWTMGSDASCSSSSGDGHPVEIAGTRIASGSHRHESAAFHDCPRVVGLPPARSSPPASCCTGGRSTSRARSIGGPLQVPDLSDTADASLRSSVAARRHGR